MIAFQYINEIQSNLFQISIHLPILNIHQISIHLSILNLIPLQDNFWSLHQSEFFDSWRWERNHTWNLNTVMRPTQWIQSLFLTIKIYFFWAEWGHFTRVPLKLLIFKLFWPFVPQILLICESILIFDRFWGSATCFLTFKVKAFQLSLSARFWGSARLRVRCDWGAGGSQDRRRQRCFFLQIFLLD